MSEQIIGKITAVLRALNNISVSGKVNIANLGGSISILESVLATLSSEHQDGSDESVM